MASDTAVRPRAPMPATSAVLADPAPRRARRWEIYFLALVATYVYALFGWWLKYHYHFSIGDALARTTDAKYMLWSRDPHAAAIGVYWAPLPTLAQLPFVAILEPLRHVEYAGPLSTALFGGGTLLVLGRICRDVGLSRMTGFFVTLAYALNPVVAYFAANGMSESCEFFFIAVSLWGLLRFLRDERNSSAVIAAAGLAGLALTKYEAAPIIVLVAIIIALVHIRRLPRGQWHETALNLAIIVLPAIFFVGIWMVYQKLILGSFFAFLHANTGGANGGAPPRDVAAALGSLPRTAQFVAHWVFVFFPAAALVVPALVLAPWRKMLAGLTVVATGVLAIIVTAYFVYSGRTVGEPRYFTPVIIVGAIALAALAGRLRERSFLHSVVDPAVVMALVLGGYTGALAETDSSASVEGEARVFNLVNGVYNDSPTVGDASAGLAQAAHKLDSLLRPGDRALIDARYDFAVTLFSYKPDQIVTTSDRDYEQLVSPTGIEARIGWAVLPENLPSGQPVEADDAYALVHRQSGWKQVWHNGRIQIWQRDPAYLKNLPMPPRG